MPSSTTCSMFGVFEHLLDGEGEIDEFDLQLSVDHDIFWFEVSMTDPFRMAISDSFEQLESNLAGFSLAKMSFHLDVVFQCHSIKMFKDEMCLKKVRKLVLRWEGGVLQCCWFYRTLRT